MMSVLETDIRGGQNDENQSTKTNGLLGMMCVGEQIVQLVRIRHINPAWKTGFFSFLTTVSSSILESQ